MFGKKAAEVVAQAYTDCGALSERQQGDEERELFLLMVERQRLECESSSWEVEHWFTSSHGTDYFSLQRERILAGIKEEVAWLTAGFEQLFAVVRARRDKPFKIRFAADDDPIYKEGWTVFTPSTRPHPTFAVERPSAGRRAQDGSPSHR